MAILDGFAHVEVTIEVDGEPLHEHQESDIIVEPPHRTLRYIEAKNDEAFEIVLTVKKGTRFIGDCIAFDMHVDGEHIGGPIIWKGDCDEDDISVVEDGRPGPRNSVQKFRFSGLEIGMLFSLLEHQASDVLIQLQVKLIGLSLTTTIGSKVSAPFSSISKTATLCEK
jgi:hypothetical protein